MPKVKITRKAFDEMMEEINSSDPANAWISHQSKVRHIRDVWKKPVWCKRLKTDEYEMLVILNYEALNRDVNIFVAEPTTFSHREGHDLNDFDFIMEHMGNNEWNLFPIIMHSGFDNLEEFRQVIRKTPTIKTFQHNTTVKVLAWGNSDELEFSKVQETAEYNVQDSSVIYASQPDMMLIEHDLWDRTTPTLTLRMAAVREIMRHNDPYS